MSSAQVFCKTAIETRRTPTVNVNPEVVITVPNVRNRVRAAMVRLALAAALVPAATFQARAQNCPPGYKVAAGACVQSCPGGYEDTGRTCVYRRQGGGGGGP